MKLILEIQTFILNITSKTMITSDTHVSCVLLDFVFISMRTGDTPTPEAILTQLVTMTLLASVAKTRETLPLARITCHRMNNYTRNVFIY